MKIKNIISFIVSLFLLFALALTEILLFIRSSLLSEECYVDSYVKNDIIDEMTKSINNDVRYYFVQQNIPQNYLGDIMTKEEVKEEFSEYVSNVIIFLRGDADNVKEINADKYLSRIDRAYEKYLAENQLITDEVSEEIVNAIKDKAKYNIEAQIVIVNDNKLFQTSKIQFARKVLTICYSKTTMVLLLSIDIVLSIILFLIWKQKINSAYAWIGYSFFATGLLLGIIFFSGYLSKFYYTIPLSPDYVVYAIGGVIKKFLKILTIYSCMLILIGIIFMSFKWIKIIKAYKNKK